MSKFPKLQSLSHWRLADWLEDILFVLLGVWLLARQDLALVTISGLVALAMLLNGVIGLIRYLFKRGAHRPENVYRPLVMLAFGFIWLNYRAILAGSVPLLMGMWSVLLGVIKLMVCAQYKRASEPTWFVPGILGVLYIVFGYLNVYDLMRGMGLSALLIGCYTAAYGLFELTELIVEGRLKKDVALIRLGGRGVRIGLPTVLSALLPSRTLRDLRRRAAGKTEDELRQLADTDGVRKAMAVKDVDESLLQSNAEVFIHLSDSALSAFGHVDLAIDGTVISYGNYDSDSNRLFGAYSDGIVAMMPRDGYVDFCIEREHKILIGFRLNLTQDMIDAMLERLHKNAPDTVEWKSKYQIWNETGRIGDEPGDVVSELARDTGARFYRITSGKYRAFFGLNTNCVRFADDMLGAIGLERMRFSGTLTPGEYLAFLEEQLGAEGKYQHLVVERKIYAFPGEEEKSDFGHRDVFQTVLAGLRGAGHKTAQETAKAVPDTPNRK